MIRVLRTAREVQDQVALLHREGKRIALVPTMGGLHEGHFSLMREGRRRADVCAASIFVNPTQFGPAEDLSRYPRHEEGDVQGCACAGVDFVWAPSVSEVYPAGFQTMVEVMELSKPWCGELRPGHFRGVATVVAKLFGVFRPDIALFGEKDFQQLKIIERMSQDLGFGVEIIGRPIVREPDGLAMSSRNGYLSTEERQRSGSLFRALMAAARLKESGENRAAHLVETALTELNKAAARIDYVTIVAPCTLEPLELLDRPSRMLIAAFIGKTRLIDNIAL